MTRGATVRIEQELNKMLPTIANSVISDLVLYWAI